MTKRETVIIREALEQTKKILEKMMKTKNKKNKEDLIAIWKQMRKIDLFFVESCRSKEMFPLFYARTGSDIFEEEWPNGETLY